MRARLTDCIKLHRNSINQNSQSLTRGPRGGRTTEVDRSAAQIDCGHPSHIIAPLPSHIIAGSGLGLETTRQRQGHNMRTALCVLSLLLAVGVAHAADPEKEVRQLLKKAEKAEAANDFRGAGATPPPSHPLATFVTPQRAFAES
jgi:hypothetical protein